MKLHTPAEAVLARALLLVVLGIFLLITPPVLAQTDDPTSNASGAVGPLRRLVSPSRCLPIWLRRLGAGEISTSIPEVTASRLSILMAMAETK